MLQTNTIPFLTDLASNNNKAWFDKNKGRYTEALNEFKDFIDQLIPHLAKIDPSINGLTSKDCVYRIYRDVRFSKDKTPYKTHFGAHMAPGGRKSKKAGFYVHVEPTGNSMVGGGIYMPEAPILKAIRNEIYQVPEELIEITEEPNFKKYFGKLWQDNKLKTAPKGFPKDFEHIELLKLKSFVVGYTPSIKEVASNNFLEKLVDVFNVMYPLNRLLNTIIDDAGLN